MSGMIRTPSGDVLKIALTDPFTGETYSANTNVTAKLRDAAEIYPRPDSWAETVAPGDFIIQRGNTAGAGWIEISKSPFANNSQTILELKPRVQMPLRLVAMLSLTHRNAGEQIPSMEFVSDDPSYGGEPVPDPVPVEILNASQTTTTITINFATAPEVPFRVGQVVSIYGFVDTRLNANSCTVASIVRPTSITVVGNDYALTSTTIASTLGNGTAFIERADMLGGARNGVSIVHGSGTVTQRRFYARAQGGLARPSGTLAGSHHVTTGTDASTAFAGAAPFSESWGVPLETFLTLSREGLVFGDRSPDASAAVSGRFRSSQVVPNPERDYLLRFRVRSTPSFTRPVAKIVSIVKAGSTTATITTDEPHGCVTGQYVGFYGVNNQTAFANQTTGLACTVLNDTQLTVVHGSSTTATSYGGFLMRVHGQQALGGAIAQVAQSVSRTDNVLSLVGNGTWATTAIGNIVELIGLRDTVTGADLGLDGSYVVRNLVTSTLTLEPVPGQAPTGDDFTSVNCGGGVVQRLGYRIHGVTFTDYQPMLTEPAFAGLNEQSNAQAVVGTVSMTSTTVAGTVAQDAAVPNPIAIGGRAASANQAAMSAAGDLVHTMHTMIGAVVQKPYAIPEAEWATSLALTATTDVEVQTAAGAGLKRHVTMIQATNTGVAAVSVLLRDGTTTRLTITIPAGQSIVMPLPTGIPLTANTALNVQLSGAGTVQFNALGYTAP